MYELTQEEIQKVEGGIGVYSLGLAVCIFLGTTYSLFEQTDNPDPKNIAATAFLGALGAGFMAFYSIL